MNFGSGQLWDNQFLVRETCHAKTSKFVRNFELDIVRFKSVRISGLLSGIHTFDVGLSMGPDCPVRVSGLGLFFSSLVIVKCSNDQRLTNVNSEESCNALT